MEEYRELTALLIGLFLGSLPTLCFGLWFRQQDMVCCGALIGSATLGTLSIICFKRWSEGR
jgi:hypothetical protein